MARIPSRTIDPALRIVEEHYLSGPIVVVLDLPLLLAGYNYPENPVLDALLLSPILLVTASFVLAWLTVGTRSSWPAALVHGAGDSIQGGLTSSIKTTRPGLYISLTELALIVVVGVIFYILLVGRANLATRVEHAS